jgi:hypothetical protein
MYCIKCGKPSPEDARYCPSCGSELQWDTADTGDTKPPSNQSSNKEEPSIGTAIFFYLMSLVLTYLPAVVVMLGISWLIKNDMIPSGPDLPLLPVLLAIGAAIGWAYWFQSYASKKGWM